MKLRTLLLVLVAGCATDLEVESTQRELISWNSLAWENLAQYFTQSRTLLASMLDQNATTAALASTPEGREVLTYFVRCGLPATQAIVIDDNHRQSWKFIGAIGLFPAWTKAVPTDSQARWIVGCMEAHVNALKMRIEISLRGTHPAYATTFDEDKRLTFEEGGMYGDREMHMFGCVGRDLLAQCGPTAVATLKYRICLRGDARCGNIDVVGACDQVCSRTADDDLVGCKGGSEKYDEVTIVNLGALSQGCVPP